MPTWTHEFLGEDPRAADVVLMIVVGTAVAAAFVAAAPPVPAWRLALAAALVFDVGAGAIANLTPSTNLYYGARPGLRWVFIAVHHHVLVVTALMGAAWPAAFATSGYTLATASLVNALAGQPRQRVVGGALLALGLVGLAWTGLPPWLLAVHALFLFKVGYAFAVRVDAPL